MHLPMQIPREGGGVRAISGDLMPESIRPSGMGHLALTKRSLVSIQTQLVIKADIVYSEKVVILKFPSDRNRIPPQGQIILWACYPTCLDLLNILLVNIPCFKCSFICSESLPQGWAFLTLLIDVSFPPWGI